MDHLKALYEAYKDTLILPEIIEDAASGGHLHILKWWKLNLCTVELYEVCRRAAKNGYLKLLKWCFKNEQSFKSRFDDKSVLECAAKRGNKDVIKWLNKKLPLSESSWCKASEYAIQGGQIELLKWITEKKKYYKLSDLVVSEASDLEIVKYLLNSGVECTDDICAFAAKAGNLKLLKYLNERGFKLGENIGKFAACSENIELLEWVQKNGYWTKIPEYYYGSVNVFKWAVENGYEYNKDYVFQILEKGNLKMLKYVKEKSIEIPREAGDIAARCRHWHIVKWLRENGYYISVYAHNMVTKSDET